LLKRLVCLWISIEETAETQTIPPTIASVRFKANAGAIILYRCISSTVFPRTFTHREIVTFIIESHLKHAYKFVDRRWAGIVAFHTT